MLKLFDKTHGAVGFITKYRDCRIESDVSTGDKTLSFTYLAKTYKIENEYYIQTRTDEYVVKEVSENDSAEQRITAVLNLEGLEQKVWMEFSVTDETLENAARLALTGTGWRLKECGVTKRRGAALKLCSSREAIQQLCESFMCEVVFDSREKTVSFYDRVGEDKGVYFLKGLNLRSLSRETDSYDYYTQIIPIGADGMTIKTINGGKNYLENYEYSTKVRPFIWQDESYTDIQALKEDAELKLKDICKPVRVYNADVIDLAAQKPEYTVLSYHLGDTIMIIDQDTGTREKQRITRMVEYPQEPDKNTCELSNTMVYFVKRVQEKVEEAADIVGGSFTSDGKIRVSDILKWEQGIAGSVTVSGIQGNVSSLQSGLSSAQSDISGLQSSYSSVMEDLTAVKATIGSIETNYLTAEEARITYATIENLSATEATVHSIQGDYATFKTTTTEELSAQRAIIDSLTSSQITTEYLEANFAKVDLANIKDGSITSAMIGTGVVGTAQIADGSITDAKIVGLTANKITAGTLDAAEIEVVNLNAANITVGTINGQQIAPGAIDLSNLAEDLSGTITNTAEDVKQALEDAGLAQSTATAAQGAAGKAQSTAETANTAAGKAQSAAESAQSTANTAKSTAEAAKTAAATAQTTADGKNTMFYQAEQPAAAGRKLNDVWFDTDDANRMYYFDGKAWTARQFGGNAIAANSITASHLTASAVTAGKIAAGAVTAGTIAANAVTAGTIAAGAVSADNLAANAVTAGKIAANAVTTATIAAGAVNADKIAAGAITAEKIAADAVTSDAILAEAVTADKIAAKTITANSGVIADAAITTAMIADLSVLTAKIADAAITTAKITDLAVTGAKIADATITNAKIKDLSADKITAGTLDADRIGAKSIKASKIDVSDLFAQSITATGTISGVTLSGATGSFSGSVTASGGKIGPWSITSSAIYKGSSVFGATGTGNMYLGDSGISISDAFKVSNKGTLTALGADITGDIRAISLEIRDLTNLVGGSSPYGEKGANFSVDRVDSYSMDNYLNLKLSGNVIGFNVLGAIYENGTKLSSRYAAYSHTHSSVASADKLNSNAGSTTRPVYFSNGKPAQCSQTLDVSVTGSAASAGHADSAHYVCLDTGENKVVVAHDSANSWDVFRPTTDNTCLLGGPAVRWKGIYSRADVVVNSDRRLKENFREFTDAYEQAYMDLKPVLYNFRNVMPGDDHDRTHSGFIAQDVEEALRRHGLDAGDMAFLCRDKAGELDENGNYVNPYAEYGISDFLYSLRYGEMAAWTAHMVQKTVLRQREQDTIIARQSAQIEWLMQMNLELLNRVAKLEAAG